MNLNEAISERLNELLDQNNMTAYKLYIRSGVSQSTISEIKNLKNKGATLKILFELCEGFEIGLADFFNSPLFERGNIID
ncbi:MAG: helix-turn-helix transcriptional regulator [Ruminococcaceae bacterium]|nr:helix-turn-helix transcriptional regulator [Oscillospiraceae bacterium]